MRQKGIYMVMNLSNNKVYIGQSINIKERWQIHLWKLRNNIHPNDHLQKSWNKYGEDSFEFSILCSSDTFTKDRLNELEEYFIFGFNSCDRDFGYNHNYGGGCPTYTLDRSTKFGGKNNPNYGGTFHGDMELIRERMKSLTRGKNYNAKPCRCLNNGNLYLCTLDAAEDMDVDVYAVRKSCNRFSYPACDTFGNPLFFTYDIEANYEELYASCVYKYNYRKVNRVNNRSVVCITTGETFRNMSDACEKYPFIDMSNLVKCCKGKIKYCGKLDGTPLYWKYF